MDASVTPNIASGDPFRQTGWPGLRARLFHLYFLVARPMTIGVRGVVHDKAANSVFLIRHTYVPGWHFPGGGVERGETVAQALGRELLEEGNIAVTGPMALKSLHFNRHASRRDHVAVYLIETFEQAAPKLPDCEVAEAGFFSIDRLPEKTTPGTRRRIAEIFGAEPVSQIAGRSSHPEPSPVMRRGVVQLWPGRHDPRRIDAFVAAVIVALDVPHVDGLGNSRHLVEIAQIARQVRDSRRSGADCT